MATTKYHGVIVCIIASLVSVPVMFAFLSNHILSQKVPQYAVQYGLLVASLGMFIHLLRPSGDFWNFETRGSIFYYFCCLFTTLSAVQLTVHGSKFTQNRPKLLDGDSVYLKTLQGISSELSYCISSYVLCLMMISRMDRYFSSRNLALYWCGATLTNELIYSISMAINRKFLLEYSTFIHLLYIAVALWSLYHFLQGNQRLIPCKLCVTSYRPLADTGIIILLFFSVAFCILRGLGALNIQQAFVKAYASSIEPIMLDPSHFGQVWIGISCAASIPCSLMGVSFLNQLLCTKNVNIALLHAGCIMQGTLVYTVYAVISAIAEPKYRLPLKNVIVVLALNIVFVTSAHLYMLRCVRGGPKVRTTVCAYDDRTEEDMVNEDNNGSDSSSDD